MVLKSVLRTANSNENQKCQIISFYCIQTICAIADVIIASMYKDACMAEVTRYLRISGGIKLCFNAISLLATFTPNNNDDRIKMFGWCTYFLTFCILLWGNVVVYGKYRASVYNENISLTPEYCGYIPFMYALISLIFQWCLLPSVICCVCGVALVAQCFSVGSADDH